MCCTDMPAGALFAQVETFQTVNPVCFLVVNRPAFPPQLNMNTRATVADPGVRYFPDLLTGYLSSSQVISLVHYILQAGETADAEAFVRELALRVPQHGDALMTIAQQLEQKGIEKGIQLGEQRGIEKGRNEGKLEVARTMLRSGIDRSTVMQMTGLTEDDLAQIRH